MLARVGDLRGRRRRCPAGLGRGRHPAGAARVHRRRARRQGGARGARAGAGGDGQLGLRVPAAADHGQPRAGLPAQGRPGVRPAARGRAARRLRPARAGGGRGLRGGRRALADGRGASGPRRARGRGGHAPRASCGGSCCRCRARARRRWCRTSRSSASSRCSELVATLRGDAEPPSMPAEAADGGRARGPSSPTSAATTALIPGLEVAAAGGHNLFLQGPPGTGKTMIARRLPSILPPLAPEEAIEVTRIQSIAGLRGAAGLVTERPFRAPHHTVSAAGLVGGANPPQPGEATLAHRGVLFLDELSEFARPSLEALRQPLEDGHVTIVRGQQVMVFPTRFMLVAASNPCPCGLGGSRCQCSAGRSRAPPPPPVRPAAGPHRHPDARRAPARRGAAPPGRAVARPRSASASSPPASASCTASPASPRSATPSSRHARSASSAGSRRARCACSASSTTATRSRPAATPASSASPAPSPTSTAPTSSAPSTSTSPRACASTTRPLAEARMRARGCARRPLA